MAINSVSIGGNLVRDAELRATSGGSFILTFDVAVNERRKQDDGTWGNETSYVKCKLFGKRAQATQPHLTKGCKVTVQGKLRQERWQTKDGQSRSEIVVLVDEFEFMDRRASQPPADAPASPQDALWDAEIPF